MPTTPDFYWPVYMVDLMLPDEYGNRPDQEEVAVGLVARDQAVEDFMQEVALVADRGVAGGFASLDSGGLVPVAELGTGTANSSTYLRGDRTWASFDEAARDALGTALVAGANITITVNDPADTITIASTGGGGSRDFPFFMGG